MRKSISELTEEQQMDLSQEINRFRKFSLSCILASAENANEKTNGWPTFELPAEGIQVSLCEIFDVLLHASRESVMQQFLHTPIGLLSGLPPEQSLEDLSVHDAMHEAFQLGFAAASLFELDLSGSDDVFDKLQGDGNDG